MTDAETKKSAEETNAKIRAAFSGLRIPAKLKPRMEDILAEQAGVRVLRPARQDRGGEE
ncbi:hypothetical protein [Ensifer adhaerens]|uniref:hypothetical protein n=1 Tax=Ensifer adhaerens TaxID=106592 RepID=UPI001319E505|nr:hypothetical protein [Ensifer adhaerens]